MDDLTPAASVRHDIDLVDLVDFGDKLAQYAREWSGRTTKATIATGLPGFDHRVRLAGGMFAVIGAEQGTGKSTLALQLCLEAAVNRPAIYVSAEDGERLVAGRLLSMLAGADLLRFLYGSAADADDAAKATHAMALLNRRMFLALFSSHRKKLMHVVEHAPEGSLVCVDYLQALTGLQAQDRRNEIRAITQELAERARARGLCLVVLSQLARPASRQQGEEPTRHHLKEAGDICDAADRIVLMWRDQGTPGAPTLLKLDKDKDGFAGQRWEMVKDSSNQTLREID